MTSNTARRVVADNMGTLHSGDRSLRRLVVFADDWGRHPSSCQHLVRHLLDRCRVDWINTIGTRMPTLSPALLARGLEKLKHWSAQSNDGLETAVENPAVHNPPMYPGFRSDWQRRLNAWSLARFMRSRIANLSEAVVLSTIPLVADLPARVQVRRWVYYCVDDFSVWPGLDSKPLREMERRFVAEADRIVAAGENLAERMRSLGRDSTVVSHGLDLEPWRAEPGRASLPPLEHPLFVFWGLIDRRLDLAVLEALAKKMSRGTIVLVGPEQDADDRLRRLDRVRLVGPRQHGELPAIAAAASVLIMPYADLPVTRAMQPLKLKEYLATGRPVVSTNIPGLLGWNDTLDVAQDPEHFAQLVLLRADSATPESQLLARERLGDETWRAKSDVLVRLLFDEAGRS